MRHLAFAIVAIAVACLLTALFGRLTAPSIEADAALQSAKALRAAELAHVTVSADGQHVTLTGRVSGGVAERTARKVVRDVWGVSKARSELVRMPRGAFELRAMRTNGYLQLSGRLPSSDAELAIRAKARYAGNEDVTVSLDLHDKGTSERGSDWVANTSALLTDALMLVEQGSFTLTDTSLRFEAVAASKMVASRVERLIARGDLPDRIELAITLSPETTSLDATEDGVIEA